MEQQETKKRSKPIMALKRTGKIIRWSLFTLLLLQVTAITLGYIFEDKVKAAVMDKLGEYLNTKVFINPEDVDLSFIRDFPMASLRFENVKALDATRKSKKDTLFSASSISFQFNMMDVIRKNYHVKKIKVKKASVRIRINAQGEDNYHFWKESKKTGEGVGFSFSLEDVEFRNVLISYINHQKKQDYGLLINQVELNGSFSSEKYTLNGNGDLFVHHLQEDSVNYISEKNILADYSLDVNGDKYKIKKCVTDIGELQLQTSGTITDSKTSTLLDLLIQGRDLDIQSVLSLLPEQYRKKFDDYESEGMFYLQAKIAGTVSHTENPGVSAGFGIENAVIKQTSSGITLSNVYVKGDYHSALENKADVLNVSRFSATLQHGFLKGNFMLRDFSEPYLELNANASMDLADAKNLFKLDTLEQATGKISMNAFYKGKFPQQVNYTQEELAAISASGELVLSGASVKFKNTPAPYDSLHASLVLNNRDVTVNFLRGKSLSSDFMLKGQLRNFLPWFLLENETMSIDAAFRSSNLNLNELLADENKSTKSDTVYRVALPGNLQLKLNTDIGHLVFRKFEASDVKGNVILQDKKLIADPLHFNTMDGRISLSGFADASREKEILVSCEADIKRINIHKLFFQLENFGQSTMQDKNLKGILTADLIFASVWSPDLTADLDKVYALSNITIERGELIGFEPMKALSRFIKVSELENIRFSTLKNQVEIKNQKILIPRMEVNSTALNVTAYGTHTFNNEIDYHVKVLLSELLAKKARKDKKENEEFAEEEEKGTSSLFLSMTGTVDEPVIRYDRKGTMEKLKQDAKSEKQTLKTILKEEFGWFKKDSTLTKKPGTKKEKEKFIIEWDENQPKKQKEEE